MTKNIFYRDVFNGKRFYHRREKKEFTKVGNSYAIDDNGNEHILSLYDRVDVIQFKPVEGLHSHLTFVNGLYSVA